MESKKKAQQNKTAITADACIPLREYFAGKVVVTPKS